MQDRGSKKWTSMMLVEHASMLQELWKDDEPVPTLDVDEQQLELMNQTLYAAFYEQKQLTLVIKENGTVCEVTGTIKKLHTNSKMIDFHDCYYRTKRISQQSILKIG